MINKTEQPEMLKKFWGFLFTKGSQEQILSIQQQIEHFRYAFNPVFNSNQLKVQIRIAFAMNVSYLYISYLLMNRSFQCQEIWIVNFLWLLGMSAMNILLIIPKIFLIMMLNLVLQQSNNIDDLIENVEQFIKSKLFIFNQTISKLIVYGYVIGFLICVTNVIFETVESQEIGSLVNYLQIIFTTRMIYASIVNTREEKGLNKVQIKDVINKKSYSLSQEECKSVSDCCSICVEDYQENDNVIKLNCKHIFHTDCIQKWFPIQNKCPNCNQYILKQL